MARRWLPTHVTSYKDRHGKERYRFRRKGFPSHHFRHAPGTPEFMEEYRRRCLRKSRRSPSALRRLPMTP
jgi:hypothetical protein